MMWTVAPTEWWQETRSIRLPEEEVVCRGGVWLMVQRESGDRLRVSRILSTDPADFLRAEFMPGQYLTAKV